MILLFIYIILCLYVFVWSSERIFKEEPGDNKAWVNAIGNILTSYFYLMGKAWSKGERFKSDWIHGFVNDFYKNLPREIDPPIDSKIPDFDNSARGGFETVSAWVVDSDQAKAFWDAMKPHIHKILDDALKKSNLVIDQKIPVLHFRCSDGPFNRLGGYHLAKYRFYKDSLKGQKEVDVLACHEHNSTDKNKVACKQYVDYLKKELENEGIKVNIKCGHYFEDFSRMFYAPLVISHGSSMSFAAGYFGRGTLVTSGHVYDEYANTPDCKICSHPRDVNLMHSEVKDYHDVDTVHEQLKG